MKLSAPIYHLKRRARLLSRAENIPLHVALDRIAVGQGFGGWSLLAAQAAANAPAGKLYALLQPGDLVLIAARPGQGKTLMGLELAVEAMKSGNRSVFFSLEYSDRDCRDRFHDIGVDLAQFASLFEFDGSDFISADHIVNGLESAPRGTFAIIDYLQLLDQKRDTPMLIDQVRTLKSFARKRGVTMAFISQIDRSYDPSVKSCPDLDDVRLPNPLDLSLFDKACFLNDGNVVFQAAQ